MENIQSLLNNWQGREVDIESIECVQTLWSGYGKLLRISFTVDNQTKQSVIAKSITFPSEVNHPKGWSTPSGDLRKRKSYDVELAFYKFLMSSHQHKAPSFKHAQLLSYKCYENGYLLLLEDLNDVGYATRTNEGNEVVLKSSLTWLAQFHAHFMNQQVEGVWTIGTYWHLATRPEEWSAMKNTLLKEKAEEVDAKLNSAKYTTLVHGDAKLANFCFTNDFSGAAAVDFQYVGYGCGIKDVMCLFSGAFKVSDYECWEEYYLQFYFDKLNSALKLPVSNKIELEQEWRGLYTIAWVDFVRFLDGWSPNHYKMNSYVMAKVNDALDSI